MDELTDAAAAIFTPEELQLPGAPGSDLPEIVDLAHGYILDLPDDDGESSPPPLSSAAAASAPDGGARGKTVERAWGNMPLTIDHAAAAERQTGARTGTYYVANAGEKLQELADLHSKWFTKTKNRRSPYCEVQQRIDTFYAFCKEEFNRRFPEYLGQPGFSELGKQKRQRTGKK